MSWILIGTDSVDVSNTSTTVIVSISVVDGVVDTSTLEISTNVQKGKI